MITLGIGRFEIDWGKNSFFRDHSALFLPSDVTRIPYYYADGVVEMKEGLARSLGSVRRRLDLLGYSLNTLPRLYKEHLDLVPDYYYPAITLCYEQFLEVFRSLDIAKVGIDEDSGDDDLGEFAMRAILEDREAARYLPSGLEVNRHLSTFLENLDPYIALRILAENEANADYPVQWRYADVVEGGWVNRDEVIAPLSDRSKILIVTEGSSDAVILERALRLRCPDIADFFYFVDMEEHYPFTGTGNLYRFCQGLSSIRIQNKMLVIFDNDAAGIEKFEQVRALPRPANMNVCKLPNHSDFKAFKTVGPNGESVDNINGAAVSIECFLDLSKAVPEGGRVRWTAYNRALRRYQGEIEGKQSLVRCFMSADWLDGEYDMARLDFLLEYLINEWVSGSAGSA